MKKLTFLNFATVVLFLLGGMDMVRGYMHTFNVRYAAENVAGIGTDPDGMFLLGAFGISNFLTGFIYFLVIWKAKHLVPYLLFLIPMSYLLGGMGITSAAVEPEAPFVGQYMMRVYLMISLFTSVSYFIFQLFKRNTTIKTKLQHL